MKKLLIFLVLFASLKGFSQGLPTPNTAWNHARFTGNLHNTVMAMDITSTSTRGVTFDVFEGQLITDSIYASKAFVRYTKDSIVAYVASVYASKTTSLSINGIALTIDQNRSWSVGTVTNISSGYGMSFSTITSSGSIIADSLTLASWKRLYKVSDSMFSVLNASIALKLNISDTANMLAGYQRQGQGVVFVYDSLSMSGLGTGASPFTLLTQTGFTAGVYTAPTVTVNNKGIITAIINGSGSVGPFLFLPTQSSAVATPVGGINLFDSAGITWIRPDGFRRTINWQTVTANRIETIPDTSFIAAGQNIQNNYSVGQIISFVGTNHLMLKNGTGFSVFNQAANGGLSIALSGNNLTVPNTNTSNLTIGTGSTFTIGGAYVNKRVGKADVAYTASATADDIIAYTSLTATRAVTAPASPSTGLTLIIKDESGNAGTFNITFVGTLDGATNPALVNTNFGCRAIYYNGTNWYTLYKFGFGWIAIILLGSIALSGIKPTGKVIKMKSRIAA